LTKELSRGLEEGQEAIGEAEGRAHIQSRPGCGRGLSWLGVDYRPPPGTSGSSRSLDGPTLAAQGQQRAATLLKGEPPGLAQSLRLHLQHPRRQVPKGPDLHRDGDKNAHETAFSRMGEA